MRRRCYNSRRPVNSSRERKALNSAVSVRHVGQEMDEKVKQRFRNESLAWATDEEAEAVFWVCEHLGISWEDANDTTWFVYDNCKTAADFARAYFLDGQYAHYFGYDSDLAYPELLECFDWNKVADFLNDHLIPEQIPGTDIMVGWWY